MTPRSGIKSEELDKRNIGKTRKGARGIRVIQEKTRENSYDKNPRGSTGDSYSRILSGSKAGGEDSHTASGRHRDEELIGGA